MKKVNVEDLRQIASFNKIVKNYIKMNELSQSMFKDAKPLESGMQSVLNETFKKQFSKTPTRLK